jgi:endo-1,4-beta-xylanase
MRKLFSVIGLSLLFVLVCAALWYHLSTPVTSFPTYTPIHGQTPTSSPSLRALGNIHHLLIGTAVNAEALQHDSQYSQLLADDFSEAVPENSMKMNIVETGPSHYNFTQADGLVAFAWAHHESVHGHVLVWANTTIPSWIQDARFTKQEAIDLLHDYITTVVTRYRHRVTSWDVVSEALSSTGSLRPCYWLQIIGPSYIALAFQWAHEADPSAGLY